MTAEEAREAQQEREQKEFQDQQNQVRARQEAEAKALDDQNRAAADKVIATWYETAMAATKRTGIRFVVLSDLANGVWQQNAHVKRVVDTITADGWKPEITTLRPPGTAIGAAAARMAMAGAQKEPVPGEVTDGQLRGWRPEGVPRFGVHFFNFDSVLIVRW
jgi:hypothetical protein